jgi:hypothetical protein
MKFDPQPWGPGDPLMFDEGDAIDMTPRGETSKRLIATLCHKMVSNGREPMDPRQTCQLWHTKENGYVALFRWSGPQVIPLGRVVPFILDHFYVDQRMVMELLTTDPRLATAMNELARNG